MNFSLSAHPYCQPSFLSPAFDYHGSSLLDPFNGQPLYDQFPFSDPSFDFTTASTVSLSELECPVSDTKFDINPSPELEPTEIEHEPFKLSNLPKRPPNAFILFRRKLARTRDKTLSFVEFSRIAGIKWKAMTGGEKRKFEDEATELREMFKQRYPGFKVKYKARNRK